jgi:GNAT superfamily N-acetyltransferase
MTAADVAPAAEMIRRADWGEREAFFAWAVDQPTLAPLVADVGGQVLATGVASAHGPVGWVGMIFVDPARRRSGLGRTITRAVIAELEARGCRSQVLIASPMGRPIYEREGFTAIDHQVKFWIDGLPPDGVTDPLVRSFEPADFEAITALDRFATGEDRRAVLAAIADPVSTWVATDPSGRDIRGFLARSPWRGGALMAPDPDHAMRLLEMRRRSTGISGKAGAGLLGSNEDGRARLRAAGWVEEMGNVRMLRGEPIDWHPNAIWGQINGAVG